MKTDRLFDSASIASCETLEYSGMARSTSDYFSRKRLVVRTLGVIGSVVSFPLVALLMGLIKVTSTGPAIFKQCRVGKNGIHFDMFKLRTMYQDAEKISGPVWSCPDDPRITPVGRFLRLLHLDELPQLWNVARGEMDLVGPRPERPYFVKRFVSEIPEYKTRLQVLPGITGLAQINLPPDETHECVRRKLAVDQAYIRAASLRFDARILGCTFLRMCGLRGGRAVRLFGLEFEVTPAANPVHRNGFSSSIDVEQSVVAKPISSKALPVGSNDGPEPEGCADALPQAAAVLAAAGNGHFGNAPEQRPDVAPRPR